jgi:hypothetical protein
VKGRIAAQIMQRYLGDVGFESRAIISADYTDGEGFG